MYPIPPEIREFEVVSTLPDRLRKREPSAWAKANLAGEVLNAFLEGPVFDGDGNLYMVDIPFGRILKLSRAGAWSVVAEYDGWPNGMKFRNPGTLLVADHKLGLVEVARDGGRLSVICSGFEGRPFHGLNDLTLASNGDVYVTDQGRSGLQAPYGRVFHIGKTGEPRLLIDGVPGPNGLALSRDERTLFLAVTRANAVWRLPLAADGTVYKAGTFIQMSGGVGPDGIVRVRADDSLLVAHPGLGLWQFRRDGTPWRFWRRDGFEYPTNLAEDPTRPGSFYVTESIKAAVLRITTT